MGTLSVEIRGAKELAAKYKGASNVINRRFLEAVWNAVIYTQRESMMLTPINKGFLRSSTKSDVRQTNNGILGVVYNTAPYASYVHDGTSKWPLSMPPKNPNTVRQFFKVVVDRPNVFDEFWNDAAKKVIDDLK